MRTRCWSGSAFVVWVSRDKHAGLVAVTEGGAFRGRSNAADGPAADERAVVEDAELEPAGERRLGPGVGEELRRELGHVVREGDLDIAVPDEGVARAEAGDAECGGGFTARTLGFLYGAPSDGLAVTDDGCFVAGAIITLGGSAIGFVWTPATGLVTADDAGCN